MDNIKKISFSSVPETLEKFKALEQADLNTPFDTAALCVLAFCVYKSDKELCFEMLNFLRGPREMSEYEKQFIRDRFMDGKDYIPRSYFDGATPENAYQPSNPLTLTICDNPYSYQNQGYAKLFLKSGGADSPREIVLRQAKDSKWYLWDQFLLAGIREPESENPWL